MIEQCLAHIERMSGTRERPLLDLALAEALRDILGVPCVRLHRCHESATGVLVWLAIESDRSGSRIVNDGSDADEMVSVEQLPQIKQFISTGLPAEDDPRNLLPILTSANHWFGIVEIDGPPLQNDQYLFAGRLVNIFKNLRDLLDYGEVDALTGLLNRKTFDRTLADVLFALKPADVDRQPIARRPHRRKLHQEMNAHWLGVIDIDHFKRINDEFGHSIGDEVLILLATMMKSSFRAHDKLFRFGGEEFVVLLKPAEAAHAKGAFDRFRDEIATREFPLVGRVTVSIGYTRIGPTDQRSRTFDNADDALYWAKQHGRNQVASYEALIATGELTPKQDHTDIEYY